MSYYQQECPNCTAKFGKYLTECPHCGHVAAEAAPRPAIQIETGQAPETVSGQSRLAYRLAAGILFLNILVGSADVLVGIIAYGAPNLPKMASMLIDIVLGIGLLQFRNDARTWVLFRAGFGAILFPLLAFTSNDLVTAIIVTAIQLGFCISLILLLTGESKTWRLIVAVGMFLILVLAPSVLFLLISVAMIIL